MKKLIILILGFGLMLTLPSAAQTKMPVSNKKELNQQARIAHGVANGELTRGETKYLVAQQNKVDRMQVHAKADGVVTAHERRRIRKQQKKSSKAIRRQKNDAQDRR